MGCGSCEVFGLQLIIAMDPAALPADLDETSRQALQVRLPAAVVCGTITGHSADNTSCNARFLAGVRPRVHQANVSSAFPQHWYVSRTSARSIRTTDTARSKYKRDSRAKARSTRIGGAARPAVTSAVSFSTRMLVSAHGLPLIS